MCFFNVKIVRHGHADGICCVIFFFFELTICLYSGTVLDMLFYLILIILFGKYSHFIEKAETQMLHNFYRTTKEGAEFEPATLRL